jgi:ABC-type phosphate transport system auxiliary subunit
VNRLRAFALFWWDFIVGDDYRIAAGIVALLGLLALLAHAGIAAWWLAPIGVFGLLSASVGEAARHSRRDDQPR